MSRGLRLTAAACAALWLVPVLGLFVQTVQAFRAGSEDPLADPHGYVSLFGIILVVPALAFGACAATALWKLARRRRGAGDWLLVMGILAGAVSLMMLPGLAMTIAQPGPGTPGVDSTGSWARLVVGIVGALVLAVVTLVVALRVRRAERPLPPQVPVWPPVVQER